jgi:hypothetical protein
MIFAEGDDPKHQHSEEAQETEDTAFIEGRELKDAVIVTKKEGLTDCRQAIHRVWLKRNAK